uniref:Uncharacterized protein n=1 Tax=Megaselia scalaris TaxID=36166 RepID=T1GE01_MEGSC
MLRPLIIGPYIDMSLYHGWALSIIYGFHMERPEYNKAVTSKDKLKWRSIHIKTRSKRREVVKKLK